MSFKIKFLILALILSTAKLLSITANKKVKTTNRATEVDYSNYMFSLSWAGSICVFHKCSHYGIDGVFNLHGLWPGASNGSSPFNCYQTYFRESDYDSEIKEMIYKYWNSFYNPNWGFINHEIQKHATCWNPELGEKSLMASNLVNILDKINLDDDISRINGYLKTAIQISKDIDPYTALKENGIVPGVGLEYDIDNIIAIFDAKYGQYSAIPICLSDRATNKMYMTELRFCLDLDYNPQPCNQSQVISKIKGCKKNKISYPPFPK